MRSHSNTRNLPDDECLVNGELLSTLVEEHGVEAEHAAQEVDLATVPIQMDYEMEVD
jgi:hypothetical protein